MGMVGSTLVDIQANITKSSDFSSYFMNLYSRLGALQSCIRLWRYLDFLWKSPEVINKDIVITSMIIITIIINPFHQNNK